MPVYEWKCACGELRQTLCALDNISAPNCPTCGLVMDRKFSSFGVKVFKEHFNQSVGQYVTSDAQFRNELKVASDEASQRMGFDVNYQPLDPADTKAACGVTDAGLEEQARRHRDLGWTERRQLWL